MKDYKITHCLATIISDLKDDNKALDDMIHAKNNKRNEDSNKIVELKRDNKWLANRNGEIIKEKDAIINELKAENKRNVDKFEMRVETLKNEVEELKADINHDAKVCEDYDDDLIKEIDELQAENKELKAEIKSYIEARKGRINKIDELKAEINELKADIRHDNWVIAKVAQKVCEDYDDDLVEVDNS